MPADSSPPSRAESAAPVAVLATDLDGTLLRADGTLSPRTRDAIAAAQRAGVPTVFVTARPPRWLDHLADVVGDATGGIALSANGAFEYHVASRTVTEVGTIAPADLAAIAARLRAAVPGIAFAVERADGFVREETFVRRRRLPTDDRVETWDAVASVAAGKLLAVAPDLAPAAFHDAVAAALGDTGELGFSGAVGLAEITARGVTKASGLARWCAARGVDRHEVWAVGDMPNDLPMLRWSGRSFAVANAHPDVRAAVHEVVAANEQDGVADILDRIALDRIAGRAGRAGDRAVAPASRQES
ncbi:hypothetical protein CLV56_0509 [Mumia flava]|uniref:Uncharacterized protein n=1 Tax=Mumia flava TaxID=1348852 RepID=A0A2M9BEC4_9ACTN|nr:HAD family hydrolase [Mumia flava]PJJ56303.1 hypothetical protein CLV56_0509 [Mumia flava]